MFEHVIVFGAGAIGSVYAARLAAAGVDVTVVARADHVHAINTAGLQLTGRQELTIRIRALPAIETIQPRTLVILSTKVNANRQAAAALAARVQPDTLILCVQNGLHAEDIVKRALDGRCEVLRAITHFGAIFRAPGVVDLKVAGSTLIEPGVRSEAIAGLLTASGLEGRVSADMRADIWRKLVINCVINPITSMVGSEVGAIASPGLDSLKQLVIDECLAVARADGVVLDTDFMRIFAEVFAGNHNIASMRQDLLKGRPTEIDHMNGAVVDLGERLGVPCPVNVALVAIIKTMEGRRVAQCAT
jgi:2-dehydropantoate 2-reductase